MREQIKQKKGLMINSFVSIDRPGTQVTIACREIPTGYSKL